MPNLWAERNLGRTSRGGDEIRLIYRWQICWNLFDLLLAAIEYTITKQTLQCKTQKGPANVPFLCEYTFRLNQRNLSILYKISQI